MGKDQEIFRSAGFAAVIQHWITKKTSGKNKSLILHKSQVKKWISKRIIDFFFFFAAFTSGKGTMLFVCVCVCLKVFNSRITFFRSAFESERRRKFVSTTFFLNYKIKFLFKKSSSSFFPTFCFKPLDFIFICFKQLSSKFCLFFKYINHIKQQFI